MEERVVLVDEQDRETGTMEKLEAHEKGLLHRALSVFIWNSRGEMLLQRRALSKYHSGGLWTNACCSHPRKNEEVLQAAGRRLLEEMGIVTSLQPAFHFIYRAELQHGLTENELDYVFTGISDMKPEPDDREVAEWKYMDMQDLYEDLDLNPARYTEWFKICLRQYAALLKTR